MFQVQGQSRWDGKANCDTEAVKASTITEAITRIRRKPTPSSLLKGLHNYSLDSGLLCPCLCQAWFYKRGSEYESSMITTPEPQSLRSATHSPWRLTFHLSGLKGKGAISLEEAAHSLSQTHEWILGQTWPLQAIIKPHNKCLKLDQVWQVGLKANKLIQTLVFPVWYWCLIWTQEHI